MSFIEPVVYLGEILDKLWETKYCFWHIFWTITATTTLQTTLRGWECQEETLVKVKEGIKRTELGISFVCGSFTHQLISCSLLCSFECHGSSMAPFLETFPWFLLRTKQGKNRVGRSGTLQTTKASESGSGWSQLSQMFQTGKNFLSCSLLFAAFPMSNHFITDCLASKIALSILGEGVFNSEEKEIL